MHAFRTLQRRTGLLAGVLALTYAAPLAGFFGTPQAAAATPLPGGSIPGMVGSVPAVGGNIGDVITTTCGNGAIIVLSFIVCPPKAA